MKPVLLVALASIGACGPTLRPCYHPPSYHVLSEYPRVNHGTIAAAWAGALDRTRRFGCPGNVKVWIRVHEGDPLTCAGRPPFYSCTSEGHSPGLYYVEIDLEATNEYPPETVLRHEFVHVLLREAGVPSSEHHARMGATGWTILPEP